MWCIADCRITVKHVLADESALGSQIKYDTNVGLGLVLRNYIIWRILKIELIVMFSDTYAFWAGGHKYIFICNFIILLSFTDICMAHYINIINR